VLSDLPLVVARAVVDLVVAQELLDVVEVSHFDVLSKIWIVTWCEKR
jgi:hypothetical protein